MRVFATAVISSLAMPVMAGDILLGLPIACDLETDCYIQQFVDLDTTDGIRDFTCGTLTYDTHKGTDFALLSLNQQAQGVDVIASAPGTVRGVRNDMDDVLQTGPSAPDVSGRECGNGVVISHGDGWETQYCHLAKGSVTVRNGDRVAMGQVLGQVGLSGQTQFPHVHLSVRKDGNVVDPFAPNADTCGISDDTLWIDAPPISPGGIIASGFAPNVPAYAEIKQGMPDRLTLSAFQDMVLWGYAFGGLLGDTMEFDISGPEGSVFTNSVVLDRAQAMWFRAGGKRAPITGWTGGTYVGTVIHMRGDQVIDTQTVSITVQ